MENENITKSIIYGNIYENRYGRFLPICSSISDRPSISSILDYLKQATYFKKFNKLAYAFRVDQMPVVFITEKKNVETQYYEGFHSDEMIQGSGEKLLHLLEKFNIRNVMIAVLIQQFNPLLPFQSVNYRAIVENSRLLLDELYKKVISYQDTTTNNKVNDLLLNDTKTVKVRKVDMGEDSKLPEEPAKVIKPKERPNYVNSTISSTNIKPTGTTFLKKSSSKKKSQPSAANYYNQQLTFLWNRINSMKQHYTKLISSITPKDLQQIKYFILYDKNPLINLVIQLLMLYLQIQDKKYFLEEYNMQNILIMNDKELKDYPKEKARKIDQIFKTNKKLTIDNVMKANKILGMLFSLIEMRLRFTKSKERIRELVQKEKIRVNMVDGGERKRIETKGSKGLYVDENVKGTKAVLIDQYNS